MEHFGERPLLTCTTWKFVTVGPIARSRHRGYTRASLFSPLLIVLPDDALRVG
jgi:hypothetical protein